IHAVTIRLPESSCRTARASPNRANSAGADAGARRATTVPATRSWPWSTTAASRSGSGAYERPMVAQIHKEKNDTLTRESAPYDRVYGPQKLRSPALKSDAADRHNALSRRAPSEAKNGAGANSCQS